MFEGLSFWVSNGRNFHFNNPGRMLIAVNNLPHYQIPFTLILMFNPAWFD